MIEGKRRSDAIAIACISTAVVAMSLPYGAAGPGFFADDWFHLGNARIDGWTMAAGSVQWGARPGAAVVYAATFGLVGDQAIVYFLLSTVLLAVGAVLLYRIVRQFESVGVAVSVSLTWIVIPNHTSLEMWPSAMNIVLAVDLLLLGVLVLLSSSTLRADTVAITSFTVAVLTYEAVGPACVMALVAAGWAARADNRARAGRLVFGGGICIGSAGLWLVTHWHPLKQGLDVWLDPTRPVPGHFGESAFGPGPAGVVLMCLILSLVVVEAAGRVMGSSWRSKRAWSMIVVGTIVIVIGTVPFVNYIYSPVGLNDRVTAVSGLGGALVIVGTAIVARTHVGVLTAVPVVVGIGFALVWRAHLVDLYATAASDGRRVVADLERRYPDPPAQDLVFGPDIVVKDNVLATLYPEDMVRWLYAERELDVVTFRGEGGFSRVDPALRVDLFELSDLDSK